MYNFILKSLKDTFFSPTPFFVEEELAEIPVMEIVYLKDDLKHIKNKHIPEHVI